jgi:hypothetical protein
MISFVMLSVVTLCRYGERSYAQCNYAECRYAASLWSV